MKNIDSINHVTGKSVYLDDMSVDQNTLHAYVFSSGIASGKIIDLNFDLAKEQPGVVDIICYKDIPGPNEIGAIIEDEPLLAEEAVHFIGQPIALVIAKNRRAARLASKFISIKYEAEAPIVNAREAFRLGKLIMPPRTFKTGNLDKAWKECVHIVEGKAESPGQEHLYLETQGAYARIRENGHLTIYSSTQGPTAVQKITSRVLDIPMNAIEVDVGRLGGGFGGKEDQATPWAVLAALACMKLKKAVKLVLDRDEDLKMTGKRHPYSSDFKIGLNKDLKILAFEADYYQNAGAAADLSPAIVERTLFHSTGSYYIPNTRTSAYSCKTNLPPNTAFRGFGAPQAFFVIECAIRKVAEKLNISPFLIQKKNLIQEDQAFPYGQVTQFARAVESWEMCEEKYNIKGIEKDISDFNASESWHKKGMAMLPLCFGISFTNTIMNHSRALVHIYSDGSIGISTAAVEMGQGVNTKMIQTACKVLSVHPSRIKIETTNTTRVANTSPTAASSAVDLNGNAVRIACQNLKERLINTAERILGVEAGTVELINERVFHLGEKSDLDWNLLVLKAFEARIQLSEVGHYATPNLFFDKTKEKGHPFAYHVYGTAICVAKVDCLRGIYEFESFKLVHDFGKSLNTDVDRGQVEGALVQALGWLTMEDLRFDDEGKLISNALSTYKVPDIHGVPKEISIAFLPDSGYNSAVFQSKAIGEPPFMYGMAGFYAIQEAIKAFNPAHNFIAIAPMTPEKTLSALYGF